MIYQDYEREALMDEIYLIEAQEEMEIDFYTPIFTEVEYEKIIKNEKSNYKMNYNKWKILSDEGYSSDAVSLLQFIEEEEELDEEHAKTAAILQLLDRKQLIFEGKLTILGKELLKNLDIDGIIPNKRVKIDKFEEWWKVYPSTDAFTYNGRTFLGAQSKKIKKDVCKKHFAAAINHNITADDIIRATAFHIEQAKKISLQKGKSELSFITNSERYLRERVYEPFINMSKTAIPELEFKSNIL